MPSTWMEEAPPPSCSMGPCPVTHQITARTTCGAVPEACPPWCVCTSPAASLRIAVATGPAWRGTVSARGSSGGVPPATSWTAAPPTAASTGSAQRVSEGSGESALTWAPSSPCRALPGPSPDLLGLVLAAGCRCEAGWTGSNCSEACTNGSFGEDCAKKCQCQNGAACDPAQGTCTCPPGFTGDTCVQECPLGWHGPGCQKPCECEHQCPCDPQTGSCNLTRAPILSSILSQAKQCLPPSEVTLQTGELSLLTGTTWLALTLALVFLLLISTAVNVSLLLSSRAERSRHLDGAYVYHPLQEMNGELLATEKEQTGDTHNPFKD
uniref:N-acetylglucosamine-1-phosphodiester alpha-N-acetylglucosaminidase n=1 Tax=Rousettus aegyptiacus TaxID=9407 RepID=A0A7J8F1U9_ROUAE|nr:N-acetylglucosamine-1-phosphodiester alpha-N-acetylglucosaminidase [Rousettus aegyptiacus]